MPKKPLYYDDADADQHKLDDMLKEALNDPNLKEADLEELPMYIGDPNEARGKIAFEKLKGNERPMFFVKKEKGLTKIREISTEEEIDKMAEGMKKLP